MLDIQFIRENPKVVAEKSKQKGYDVSIPELLELDEKRRTLQQQVDELREKRNKHAESLKSGKPTEDQIATGKDIKNQLAKLEEKLSNLDSKYLQAIAAVPNVFSDDVPLGGEADSKEIKKFGDPKQHANDHLEIASQKDWVDFERGAKVAGTKFYFIKGDLALLENALTQYALEFITKRNFTYMGVPHMVNSRIATGTGFAPRTDEQSDEYFIEGEDLSLIATAEMPLTGYHADEIIDEDKLDLLYAALSPCYRKEAGTYGKHTRGLYRVHQFNKLEMYAYCKPEDSKSMHQKLLGIEEEFWQSIGLPYRVVNIASGDLGAPAAKKYDIEYWSPVDSAYRELTSCSNCTDYQTRNLNIRVRRKDGKVEMLHSLNGTVVALARGLVAIMENFQDTEGNVIIPEVLRPYMGGKEKI